MHAPPSGADERSRPSDIDIGRHDLEDQVAARKPKWRTPLLGDTPLRVGRTTTESSLTVPVRFFTMFIGVMSAAEPRWASIWLVVLDTRVVSHDPSGTGHPVRPT